MLDLARSRNEQQLENFHLDENEEDSSARIVVDTAAAEEEDSVVVEDIVVDDEVSMDHRMVKVDVVEDSSADHNDVVEDSQEVLRICNLDRSSVLRKLIVVEVE